MKTKSLPEKPEQKHLDAIFRAWNHYGSGSEKRLLGAPEAERIYRELLQVAEEATDEKLVKEIECLRVKPGDVLVMRLTQPASLEHVEKLAHQMRLAEGKAAIKFVLLSHDLEPVAVQDGGA